MRKALCIRKISGYHESLQVDKIDRENSKTDHELKALIKTDPLS